MPRRILLLVIRLTITIMVLPWQANSIQCKAGWQEWNHACYKVSNGRTTFANAAASCQQHGANLASIHSVEENEFVRNFSGGKDVFIGLSDAKMEGTFVWSDGSTLAYTNWENGEPDNDYGVGDCVILVAAANAKWNDTPCNMWYEYVCKFTMPKPYNEQEMKAMKKEQSFISYEKKALAYHVIYKKTASSLIHCALLCLNNSACKSINFISRIEQEEGECELNDASTKDFPMHLFVSVGSTHAVTNDL